MYMYGIKLYMYMYSEVHSKVAMDILDLEAAKSIVSSVGHEFVNDIVPKLIVSQNSQYQSSS